MLLILSLLFYSGQVGAQLPQVAEQKVISFSPAASGEFAEFVAGHSRFGEASCRAVVFRPLLTAEEDTVTEGDRLECDLIQADGTAVKVVKALDNTQVRAWGTRWTEDKAVSLRGGLAGEMSNYLTTKALRDVLVNTDASVWSTAIVCDGNFNQCIDEVTLLTKRGDGGVMQTFCTRWTDLKIDANAALERYIEPRPNDDSETQKRRRINSEIKEGVRNVFTQFCTIR